MRRKLTAVALGATLLALAPASASAAQRCAGADAQPGTVSSKAMERATLCLLNAERRHLRLRALRWSRGLTRAARTHSRGMVRRSYFSHASSNGGDFAARIRRTGYRSATLGENIAWGAEEHGAPCAIVAAWMASPGHRANILHPAFRRVGVGVARGGPQAGMRDAGMYTTDFGSR